jgi:hypothetical protein
MLTSYKATFTFKISKDILLSLELKRFEFRAREFSDISYYTVIVLT